MPEPIIRRGLKLVAELPKGNWQMAIYDDMIVLTCPEHEPRVLKDGILEILKPGFPR